MDSAPAASSREDLIQVRRKAVIEFEIGRVPQAPNRTIALACHTSSSSVATVRDELEQSSATAPEIDARNAA